jgi:hypothetical protein
MVSAQKVVSTAQFPGEMQPALWLVVRFDSISACALRQRIDQVSRFRTAADPQESGTSLAKVNGPSLSRAILKLYSQHRCKWQLGAHPDSRLPDNPNSAALSCRSPRAIVYQS